MPAPVTFILPADILPADILPADILPADILPADIPSAEIVPVAADYPQCDQRSALANCPRSAYVR